MRRWAACASPGRPSSTKFGADADVPGSVCLRDVDVSGLPEADANRPVPTSSGTASATWKHDEGIDEAGRGRRRDVARPGACARVGRQSDRPGARPSSSAAAAQPAIVSRRQARSRSATTVAAMGGRNTRRTRTPTVTQNDERARARANSAAAPPGTALRAASRPRVAPSAVFSASSADRRSPVRIEQVADVAAGHEQHQHGHPRRRPAGPSCRASAPAPGRRQVAEMRRYAVPLAIHPLDLVHGVEDLLGVGLGRGAVDAWAQPREGHQTCSSQSLVRQSGVGDPALQRHPDIDGIVIDAGEAARTDRHDGVRPLAEPQRPADDVQGAAEALLPKCVADHDRVGVRTAGARSAATRGAASGPARRNRPRRKRSPRTAPASAPRPEPIRSFMKGAIASISCRRPLREPLDSVTKLVHQACRAHRPTSAHRSVAPATDRRRASAGGAAGDRARRRGRPCC